MLRTRSPRKEKISNCYLHSNSLSNKMDNSLLAVRDINHKYIVVDRRRRIIGKPVYPSLIWREGMVMLPRSTCRPRCCRPNLSLCPVIWLWIAGFFHSTKYYVFQHFPFNQLLGLYDCAPVIGQTRTFALTGKFLVFLFSVGCRSPPSDFGFSFSHANKSKLEDYI